MAVTGTVLVIDDCMSVRILLERWLTDRGYDALLAGSTEEALKILAHCRVDVALCDVRLPGDHDGVWLAQHIGRLHPETVVVFATGVAELDARATLRPGVAGYLMKPFVRDDVLEILEVAFAMAMQCQPPVAQRLLTAETVEGVIVE